MKSINFGWLLTLCLFICPAYAADPTDVTQLIKNLKPKVVNIEVSVTQGLAGDETGSWVGTGFIVDAKKGLIVTNRHVAGKSPAKYKVNFYNGEYSTRVRLRYYDAWHDFAFLQVDKNSIQFDLEEVSLGKSSELREQDKVILIGNNEAQAYTVLYGEVMNTEVDAGDRHSATVQVVYGNRGGSSGSPIFDYKGNVVAIHYKGTGTTGLELRIEYIQDALDQLVTGKAACRRGDIGCDLDLIPISQAREYFSLPDDAAETIRKSGQNIKRAICVQGVIPCSPAEGQLQPGDIVTSVDGATVGNDLYAFDKAVDARLGKKVRVGVMRNGAPKEFELQVQDANSNKVDRFVQFGGGIVHELTPGLRLKHSIGVPHGVFLSQAEKGSSLDMGVRPGNSLMRAIVIEAVNGTATPDLNAFVQHVSKLKDGTPINMTIRDYWHTSANPRAVPLTLSLTFHPFKEFRLQENGDWLEIQAKEKRASAIP